MAAEPQSQSQSQPDVGTESAINRLLNRQAQLADQQAEVQAQLAALLPAKYGSNIKLELLMLRHKLHALRAYAALHGTTLFFFVFRGTQGWDGQFKLPSSETRPPSECL